MSQMNICLPLEGFDKKISQKSLIHQVKFQTSEDSEQLEHPHSMISLDCAHEQI